MARFRRRAGRATPGEDIRSVQAHTSEAALDADPGSVDQGPYAQGASKLSCKILITDGGPGTSQELGQYVDGVNEE